MRKKEKEITAKSEIEKILKNNTVCRIALSENNMPYIVPMSYGYEEGKLYLHCAKEGKKLDIIRKNSRVCFEVSDSIELIKADIPCKFSTKFRSLIGTGNIEIAEDRNMVKKGLEIIMQQHAGTEQWEFPEKIYDHVHILVIRIDNVTGKKSGI